MTKSRRRNLSSGAIQRVALSATVCLTVLSNASTEVWGGDKSYRYSIIRIPGLSGSDSEIVRAINDHGHVVGASDIDPGAFHPFFWDGIRIIDLGTFGGPEGKAWDINNNDEVVGEAMDAAGDDQAFYWNGGDLVMLGSETLRLARAYCINEQGQIAGEGARYGEDIGHPILWDDGQTIVLPEVDPEHGGGEVSDINENGVLVGESWAGTARQATIWYNNQVLILGSLGDGVSRSLAHALNNDNVIVGQSRGVGPNPVEYAAMWINGKGHNVSKYGNHIGGRLAVIRSINDRGEFVGGFQGRQDEQGHPYVYTPGRGFEAIERLLPPNTIWDFDYFLPSDYDINNHGQIVGTATLWSDPQRLGHSYILTPIEPELDLQIPDGPLQADAVNTLRIEGAQPGATIKFFYGKEGGGQFIPGCGALEAMTQINDPVRFGEATADGNGVAVLDIFVPAHAAAHKGFLIQALDLANCNESQLVVKSAE